MPGRSKVGRQTTNYKKRALVQLDELKKEILALDLNIDDWSPETKLIKKLNKIKSTIEKIREPQTRKAIKKQNK